MMDEGLGALLPGSGRGKEDNARPINALARPPRFSCPLLP